MLFQDKIVRVVHLWQKNNVFPPETIQSLLQHDGSAAVGSLQVASQPSNTEATNVSSVAGTSLMLNSLYFS